MQASLPTRGMKPEVRRAVWDAERARRVARIKAAAIAYAEKHGRKPTTVELEAEMIADGGEQIGRRLVWRYAFDQREASRSDGLGDLIHRRDLVGKARDASPTASKECEPRATNPAPRGLDRAAWDAWGEREVERVRRNSIRLDGRVRELWEAWA